MSRPWIVFAALLVGAALAAPAATAPVQGQKRGGTIVVGYPSIAEPPCLNPLTCTSTVEPALTQVLEGAFELGPDLVLRPNLVSEVTPGRNPFSLTYHIRREARWSDGVPVTARDFRFTHDAFAAHWPDSEGLYDHVLRTQVLDAKTFRVVLREPFAEWRDLYLMVLPRHALVGEDVTKIWRDGVESPKTGQPIGSGPFLLSRFERGRQFTLARNRGYWGPHPAHLDRLLLRFTAVNPRDPLAQLRANEVDMGFTLGGTQHFTADEARAIRRLPGWLTAAWPSASREHFVFRVGPGGHSALRLKLVRQALAYGIDRVAIAREIQQDVRAASRTPLDSTVFLPPEPFYQPIWRRYRHDLARARRLLGQAGCRRGPDGIYVCAGERLRLRFRTTAGAPVRERVLALAAAQLREVGVQVDSAYAPPDVFFEQILPGGDFDAALFAWGGLGGRIWPEALCGHAQNFGGFCSRLVMRDAGQNLIGSPAARARALNHVDAKLATAVPVLPVVQQVGRIFHRSNVRGLVLGGTPFQTFENSEDWWLAPER